MKSNSFTGSLFLLAVFVAVAQQAAAGQYEVYVGYADNLRPTPFFPNPFFGDPSVGLYAGQDPSVALDSGAIRIRNSGATNLTLNSFSVQMRPALGVDAPISIWGASFPFVLQPGKSAIFVQTAQYNFDTSEFTVVPNDLTNNCSVGPLSATPICTGNAPLLSIAVDGQAKSFSDTAHVLDTGGFDAACCLFNGNESLQWRLIGTTGVNDPGGVVPEPSTYALLGFGLLGLAMARRRRMS